MNINGQGKKLINTLGESRVLLNEPMSKYSSFRLGGAADYFYRAKNIQELSSAVCCAREMEIPVFIMGGGTNLLIGDKGVRGLVVKNDTSNIKMLGIKGKKTGFSSAKTSEQIAYLEVESGVSVNRLVRFSLGLGFAGLEHFLGQPGSVGGAVYINAHNMRKGIFFGDRVVEAKILKRNREIVTVAQNYFRFGYDKSVLQKTGEIVLSAVVALRRDDKAKLWKEAQETLEYRQKTQPTGIYSSGCTFRNISKSDAIRLSTPNYTTSAGFLLDSLGFKGKKAGEAMYSQYHGNFIVHSGKAKPTDVLKLIRMAKEKVKEKFNIELHEEIVIIGDF